jgi:hypothetical protein
MQRHKARFVELRFADVQLRRLKLKLDVVSLETDSFAHP